MKASDKDDVFFGKLLLFGEYSVLAGGQAFTVPLKAFWGKLDFYDENIIASNPDVAASAEDLKQFFVFLRKSPHPYAFHPDLDRLAIDLERGMYFNSNIPRGYGAGSSGALVAAIFHKYFHPVSERNHPEDFTTIKHLKIQLAQMESFFHGKSSGIDPLSSFLGRPIILYGQGNISLMETGPISERWFLTDTGFPRKTGSMVNAYEEMLQSGELDAEKLKILNNSTLNAFISGDKDALSVQLDQLSRFQLQYMKKMIPLQLQDWWEEGLAEGIFQLKLCGSGGGGFNIGFAIDRERTHQYFNHRSTKIIWLHNHL
jgi:mevalonate kinase